MSKKVPTVKPKTEPRLVRNAVDAVENQLKDMVKKAAESQGVKNPEMPASIRNALKTWRIANPLGRLEPIPAYLSSAIDDWDRKGRPVKSTVHHRPETGTSQESPDSGFKPKEVYKEIEKQVKNKAKEMKITNPEMPRSLRKAFDIWLAANPANERERKVPKHVENAIREWMAAGRPLQSSRPTRETVRLPEPPVSGYRPKSVYKEIENEVKNEAKRMKITDPEMPRSISKAFKVWFAANPANEKEPKMPKDVRKAIKEWEAEGRPVQSSRPTRETVRTPEPPVSDFKPKEVYKEIEKQVKNEAKEMKITDPEMPRSLRKAFDIWFAANPANERERKVPKHVENAIREWMAEGRPLQPKKKVKPVGETLILTPEEFYKNMKMKVKKEGERQGVDRPTIPVPIKIAIDKWKQNNPNGKPEKIPRDLQQAENDWLERGAPVQHISYYTYKTILEKCREDGRNLGRIQGVPDPRLPRALVDAIQAWKERDPRETPVLYDDIPQDVRRALEDWKRRGRPVGLNRNWAGATFPGGIPAWDPMMQDIDYEAEYEKEADRSIQKMRGEIQPRGRGKYEGEEMDHFKHRLFKESIAGTHKAWREGAGGGRKEDLLKERGFVKGRDGMYYPKKLKRNVPWLQPQPGFVEMPRPSPGVQRQKEWEAKQWADWKGMRDRKLYRTSEYELREIDRSLAAKNYLKNRERLIRDGLSLRDIRQPRTPRARPVPTPVVDMLERRLHLWTDFPEKEEESASAPDVRHLELEYSDDDADTVWSYGGQDETPSDDDSGFESR